MKRRQLFYIFTIGLFITFLSTLVNAQSKQDEGTFEIENIESLDANGNVIPGSGSKPPKSSSPSSPPPPSAPAPAPAPASPPKPSSPSPAPATAPAQPRRLQEADDTKSPTSSPPIAPVSAPSSSASSNTVKTTSSSPAGNSVNPAGSTTSSTTSSQCDLFACQKDGIQGIQCVDTSKSKPTCSPLIFTSTPLINNQAMCIRNTMKCVFDTRKNMCAFQVPNGLAKCLAVKAPYSTTGSNSNSNNTLETQEPIAQPPPAIPPTPPSANTAGPSSFPSNSQEICKSPQHSSTLYCRVMRLSEHYTTMPRTERNTNLYSMLKRYFYESTKFVYTDEQLKPIKSQIESMSEEENVRTTVGIYRILMKLL